MSCTATRNLERFQFEKIEPKYTKHRKILYSPYGLEWVREALLYCRFYYEHAMRNNYLNKDGARIFAYCLVNGRKNDWDVLIWYLESWDFTLENWSQYHTRKEPYTPMIPDTNIPNKVNLERVRSFFPESV